MAHCAFEGVLTGGSGGPRRGPPTFGAPKPIAASSIWPVGNDVLARQHLLAVANICMVALGFVALAPADLSGA